MLALGAIKVRAGEKVNALQQSCRLLFVPDNPFRDSVTVGRSLNPEHRIALAGQPKQNYWYGPCSVDLTT